MWPSLSWFDLAPFLNCDESFALLVSGALSALNGALVLESVLSKGLLA